MPIFPPLADVCEHISYLRFLKSHDAFYEDGTKVRPIIDTLITFYWLPLLCWYYGHEYEVVADAENGSEDVWCKRCGHSHHFYMN